MKNSRKTAGATLVLTVLMVMLLLAAVVVVTAQLAIAARRSATDQDVTAQTQYVAESGVARSQARLNLVSDLLSTDMAVPANTLSSTVLTDVLNLCGLTALPATVTANILCDASGSAGGLLGSVSNLSSSSRLKLFSDFLTNANFAARGYPIGGTNTVAQFWADTFGGTALSGVAGSGTFNTNTGINVKQVKYLGTDAYQVIFSLPDVSSTSTTTGNAAKRSLKVASVNTTYTFNINRGSFAQYALFTNHHFTDSTAESGCANNTSNCSRITFTSNTLFSGPIHSNENMLFQGQPYFGGQVTSAGCPAGHIASSNGTEYCDVAVTPGARTYGGQFYTPAAMSPNSSAPALTGCAQYYNNGTCYAQATSTPQFLGGVDWAAAFIPLPKNANNQAVQAAAGGLSLSGTVNSINLVATTSPIALQGAGSQNVQLITYNQTLNGNTATTQLAIAADKSVFVLSGTSWVPAVQLNGVYVPATLPVAQNINPTPFNGVIFAQNGVSSVTGPPRSNASDPASAGAAVASFSQLTLASSGTVHIKSDLKYADPPCSGSNSTSTGSFVAATCTNKNAKNILGIYSSGGDVLIDSPAKYTDSNNPGVGKDVNIQAVLMSSAGKVTVDGYDQGTADSSILGKVHLMGGIIENYYGAFGISDGHGFGRDFVYDTRTSDGLAPPSFPTQATWQVTLPTALKLSTGSLIQQPAQ